MSVTNETVLERLKTISGPDFSGNIVELGMVSEFGAHRNHYASWIFNGAIGELRGVFGIHIAALAASHGLDVEGDLASILPATATDIERT